MAELPEAPPRRARRRAVLRLVSAGLGCWLAVLAHGPVRAGLLAEPVVEPLAGAAARAALTLAEQRAERARLIERHRRLERRMEVTSATERGAERRLRRLAADYVSLGRTAAELDLTLTEQRATVRRKQQRLEGLLAEIVQLSRQENDDARRLAQLRAVAGSLAHPFAAARAALDTNRAARTAIDEQLAAIAAASVEARQAMVDAEARAVRLARAVDANRRRATEAADRLVAATVASRVASLRRDRVAASRALAAAQMSSPRVASAAASARPGRPVPVLLEPPALTAQASLVRPPVPAVAHYDLPQTAVGGLAFDDADRALGGGHVVPVAGAVVSRFGEGQKPPFDRGLSIEVEDRRLVRAPRDGRVVFARAYEGFGLLLIIDHGNEYHSLLSGLSRFVVHEGWSVRAGQMIGTLEPGDQVAGRLYVELRRRGVPVDPLTWFAAGQDKVRS